jgi:hypothetical protein
MIIENRLRKPTLFHLLSIGDLFTLDGPEVYMKLQPFQRNGLNYNAVVQNNGAMCVFADNTNVRVCTGVLTIKD